PAADKQGHIYAATGNGPFDANTGGRDYSDTVLKLKASNLKVVDYFTPTNQQWMDDFDRDLGSGGILLLPPQPGPRRHVLIASGKEGKVYVINRDRMGHFSAKGDRVPQAIPGVTNQTYDTPAYFNQTVYYVGTGAQQPGRPANVLLAMHLNRGLVTFT